ncbi:MAG: PQQ-binding-like beta-propeller repeat protein [Candidatus Hydrogenedentes bacterium]|nr:PQQ-binding-like beta-propeller repeat protein [Candidatus Hydrogenedentota bacterium]
MGIDRRTFLRTIMAAGTVSGVPVAFAHLAPDVRSSVWTALDQVAFAAAQQTGWPEFRGPFGDGHVRPQGDTQPVGLPVSWSETENVKWKTALPLKGWSTPVVLDGQVWMTMATDEGTEFFAVCLDAKTGEIRFNEKVFTCDKPEPLGNGVNGYASPSPVIEAGRVYVHFGVYGTACLDTTTGKPIWSRNDLPCRHYRGPGSSPIIFENLLVLTFDGVDQQYLTALDKTTGETRWRTDRTTKWNDLDETGKPKREGDYRKAFSTPLAIKVGLSYQLVSAGSSSAFAYEPLTGKEIWNVPTTGYTSASRPVYGDGLVFVVSGRGESELLAIRPDGHGDISETHVAWKTAESAILPQEPSPIFIDGLLYLISNSGMITCLEAATGAKVWEQKAGGNYVTSPIFADGHIYFSSTQGKTTVLKAGKTPEIVATNELEDGFMASPAVDGNALILRTKTHVYRIEG